MTALAEFFDRLDETATRQNPGDPAALVDDTALADAAALMTPMFERMAERLGVSLDEARDEIIERVGQPVAVVRERIDAGDDVEESLTMIAAAAGLQFFLAGGLWEQERHLPSLDDAAS